MRLIAVAMKEESSGTRNAEVTSMLDYGYATYKTIEVINKDEVISEAEVDKASLKYASIVAVQNVSILKKKTESVGKITYELKLSNLKAPIKAGEVVGTLNIKENNKVINKVDVTIKEDINKASLMDLYLRHLSDIVDGKISF